MESFGSKIFEIQEVSVKELESVKMGINTFAKGAMKLIENQRGQSLSPLILKSQMTFHVHRLMQHSNHKN